MTTAPISGEVSYGRRLTEIAAERPDDVDLIVVDRDGNERAVTWRELETRANQIAAGARRPEASGRTTSSPWPCRAASSTSSSPSRSGSSARRCCRCATTCPTGRWTGC